MPNNEKKKILLVEDEVIIAMVEKKCLEKYGYAVITVSSGEEAITTIEKQTDVDLILMDIDLGKGMDGTEAAQKILAYHDLPVIFLSSYTGPEVVEKTEKITSYGYIVKNTGETVLNSAIKMAFKLFQAKKIYIDHFMYSINGLSIYTMINDNHGKPIDAKYLNVNKAYEDQIGLSAHDIIGKTIKTMYPRGEADELFMTFVQAVTHNKTIQKEIFFTPVKEWFHVNVLPLGYESFTVVTHNITAQKQSEAKQRQKEHLIIEKINAMTEVPEPEGDIQGLKLAHIIDPAVLQAILEDFHALTNIGSAIVDLSGDIIVAVGWQEICTKFHRQHPETEMNCRESDIALSFGIPPGTFKTYRCKNNMWDMAAPIVIGNRHMGNIFLGQFFFDDEKPDISLFIEQAHKYGFNEKDYLGALNKVPRWNIKTVNTAMSFYTKLAGMISNMGYNVIKTSQMLTEHKQIEKSIHQLLIEKEAILKEAHHRIKNNMGIVNSLLYLQSETHAKNQLETDCEQILKEAASRVRSMMILYDKLYRSETHHQLNIKQFLPDLIAEIIGQYYPELPVKTEIEMENIVLEANVLPCIGIMVNELITNSIKHGFTDYTNAIIGIKVYKQDAQVIIEYTDNGKGLPEWVLQEKKETFGLQLINMMAKQIDGEFTIENGQGAFFIITFPI